MKKIFTSGTLYEVINDWLFFIKNIDYAWRCIDNNNPLRLIGDNAYGIVH
jgi:hypothetical protein